jgi:hypothetical protein
MLASLNSAQILMTGHVSLLATLDCKLAHLPLALLGGRLLLPSTVASEQCGNVTDVAHCTAIYLTASHHAFMYVATSTPAYDKWQQMLHIPCI